MGSLNQRAFIISRGGAGGEAGYYKAKKSRGGEGKGVKGK